MLHKRLVVFFLIVSLVIKNSKAQDYSLLQHYTSSNGLPQNSVVDMHFDGNQNLWITTDGGVVMLDGKKTTTHFPKNKIGLLSRRFRSIMHIAGTLMLDDEFGNIYRVFENNRIEAYYPDNKDLLIGNMKVDGVFYNFESYLRVKKSMVGLPRGTYPTKAIAGNNYQQIVVHNKYILLYDKQGYPFKRIEMNGSLAVSGNWAGNFFYVLDNENALWRVDFEKEKLEEVHIKGTPFNKNQRITFSDYIDGVGNSFIAVNNNIYQLIQNAPNQFEIKFLFKHDFKDEISKILYNQQAKQILIGTFSNGLYIYNEVKVKSVKYEGGFSENNFYAITAYTDTSVIAHKNRVLSMHSKKDYILNPPIVTVVLYEDKSGNFWYSKEDTMYSFKRGEHHLKKYPLRNSIKKGITAFWDDGNKLWLGNALGLGYYTGDSIHYVARYPLKGVYNICYRIFKINKNTFLAGTQTGLYIIDIANGKVKKYPTLEGVAVREIQQISGYIFVCTYGNGFYIINGDQLVKLPDYGNTNLNHVHTLFKDVFDRIWLTTNKGLFYTYYSDITSYLNDSSYRIDYTVFNEADGIANAEFNGGCQPAQATLANGMKVLPTIDGLVWFNPNNIQQSVYTPPVNIYQLTVDGDTLHSIKEVHFSGWNKTITVHFQHAHWGNIENRKLYYKLKGLDNQWHKVNDHENFVVFKNLPSGNYELLLSIYSNGLYITNETSRLFFDVHKRYYQEFWFWLAIIVFIGLVFFFGLQWDKARSKKKQYRLEALINSKSKELVEKNNLLADKITTLTTAQQELEESLDMKNKFISILSHDVISPLRFINMYARINIEENAANASKLTSALTEIKDSTEKLRHNAQNVLTWIKYNNKRIEIRAQKLSPFALIENIFETFNAAARHQQVQFCNLTSEEDIMTSDENILLVVLQNIISNALKATRNGKIVVDGYWEHGHYIFKIQDNGAGMHEAEVKRLQKMGGQKITPKHTDAGNGIGYFIIDELLTHISGSYRIESEYGKGTIVWVKIPSYEK